ncbi:MAG: MoaD/ThiS family protein [Methanoregulaceae archaeon]|jgi:molybdopterin synthase sulfur carrier subunit|nr:MoaD/ThiS family protein [Methanoregulaceae archaeon]
MRIQLKAFAGFREILGPDLALELPEGSTLTGLLEELGRRSPGIKEALFDDQGTPRRSVIIMVNKKRQTRSEFGSWELNDGDEVAIYPPVAGG